MESIFVINRFESDCNVKELYDDVYAQELYCTNVLDIPDEKIYGTEMIDKGLLEIILSDVDQHEIYEDWYINLSRMST
ncbi:MAG TPA: hypothetical protein EYH42_09920 [Sulfurovum sp.]|nr:hypothetical protein [Sulfurovum sp.]